MTQSSADATLLARGSAFDQIGSELLSALDACRPQCLSLHDATGDVLWLNAGVIGPDEHGYVLDALDELALETERTHMQRRLADNRRALFMGARDPAGNCTALVFVVLDCPGGPEDHQPLPANLAALMRRLSMQMAPTAAKIAAAPEARAAVAPVAAIAGSRAAAFDVIELELEPTVQPIKLPTAQPAVQPIKQSAAQPIKQPTAQPAAQPIKQSAAQPVKQPAAQPIKQSIKQPIAQPIQQPIPKPESKPAVAQKPAVISEANAVTMLAPIAPMEALAAAGLVTQSTGESLPIRARKFVRLHGRGSNRRYEITILSPGEGQDIRILKAVSGWLSHHLDQYTEEHASFAVPISPAAALDGRFVAALGGALNFRSLPEGMLGLLLPSTAWRHPGTGPLLAQCERLQCPVTLDDFSLRHDGFQILRHKAIRMVKLDPQITGMAMNDRFARAALAAITQSARVLGLHCIAKGDISSSRARWLAAAGIDYADPATASAAGGQAPKGVARHSLEQVS